MYDYVLISLRVKKKYDDRKWFSDFMQSCFRLIYSVIWNANRSPKTPAKKPEELWPLNGDKKTSKDFKDFAQRMREKYGKHR